MSEREQNEILSLYNFQNNKIKVIHSKCKRFAEGHSLHDVTVKKCIRYWLLSALMYFLFIGVIGWNIVLLINGSTNFLVVIFTILIMIVFMLLLAMSISGISDEQYFYLYKYIKKYRDKYDFLILINNELDLMCKNKDDANLFEKYLISHECKHIKNGIDKIYEVSESWVDYFAIKKLNVDPMRIWNIERSMLER